MIWKTKEPRDYLPGSKIIKILTSWQNSDNLEEFYQPLAAHSASTWSHILNLKVIIEIWLADGDLNFVVHKFDSSVEHFDRSNIAHAKFWSCINGSIFIKWHMITLDVDSIVNWLSRFIHNLELIREKYTNAIPTMRLTKLNILRL